MVSHDQSVPRSGVLRILTILVETQALFGRTFDDEVYFLGSITKVQSGQRTWASIGDVDILIGGGQMAQNFWTFLRALLERGLRSVWDVCYVPPSILDAWKPCFSRKEHPLSLTLDCEAKRMASQGPEFKQYNLDIKLDPSIVSRFRSRQLGCTGTLRIWPATILERQSFTPCFYILTCFICPKTRQDSDYCSL